MAKRAKVEPTYLADGASIRVAVHDVIRALNEIDSHELTAKFTRASKRNEAFVRIDSATVNFIKDFFVANRLDEQPIGRHIVNARGRHGAPEAVRARGTRAAAARDRFDCDFGNH